MPQKRLPKASLPVNNDVENVIRIAYVLDIGDIRCEIDSPKRKEVYSKFFGDYGESNIDEYFNWNEVQGEKLGDFLHLQKEMSDIEKKLQSNIGKN